jgi:uncharacterized RDD family membrane protein YckC
MPATITIVTPENVEIRYELAGIGSRSLAAIVDILIQVLVLVILVYIFTSLGAHGLRLPETLSPWVAGAAIILLFGFFWGYSIFFETRWSGQTPGKRWLRLRVIKDGGYPIDFRAALIRNLMRYVDWLPSLYAVGVVSIFFSRDYKRLGDFVAGTLVIQEATGRRGAHAERSEVGLATGREVQVPPLRPVAPSPARPVAPEGLPPFDVSRVTRAEYQAIRHYLDRRAALPALARDRLAQKLAAPLAAHLQWREAEERPNDPNAFLEAVALWYERAHGS